MIKIITGIWSLVTLTWYLFESCKIMHVQKVRVATQQWFFPPLIFEPPVQLCTHFCIIPNVGMYLCIVFNLDMGIYDVLYTNKDSCIALSSCTSYAYNVQIIPTTCENMFAGLRLLVACIAIAGNDAVKNKITEFCHSKTSLACWCSLARCSRKIKAERN